jgi:hypothetical protein
MAVQDGESFLLQVMVDLPLRCLDYGTDSRKTCRTCLIHDARCWPISPVGRSPDRELLPIGPVTCPLSGPMAAAQNLWVGLLLLPTKVQSHLSVYASVCAVCTNRTGLYRPGKSTEVLSRLFCRRRTVAR